MDKTYRPFHQLPYCCVPAILQWALYRKGLDILDQETIGAALGLRMPERFRGLISNKDILLIPDDSKEFGTQILKKKYSINRFFLKYKIPLKISKEYKFRNLSVLEKFIIKNIKTDKDIILRFNNSVFQPKKGTGHFSLICSYDKSKKKVKIGDPEPPFFKSLSLDKLLESMSDKFDSNERGLYLIYSTEGN